MILKKLISSILAVSVSCAFAATAFAASPTNATNSNHRAYSSGYRVATNGDYNGNINGNNGGEYNGGSNGGDDQGPSSPTVSSIKLNKNALTMNKGATYKLSATIKGSFNGNIVWLSSNKKIATVDSNGKVIAVNTGTCVITVKKGNVSAICKVTVQKAATIKSIDSVSVSTTIGEAPELPDKVTAVYTDGTKKSVSVTWADISSDNYESAGSFTVYGTVAGTRVKALANVTVIDDSGDDYDDIESIDDVYVDTSVGISPDLPDTVTAELDDGSTESVPVTWDTIDSSQYDRVGTFTVYGTIDGSDIEAVATVTVTDDSDD